MGIRIELSSHNIKKLIIKIKTGPSILTHKSKNYYIRKLKKMFFTKKKRFLQSLNRFSDPCHGYDVIDQSIIYYPKVALKSNILNI